MPGDGHHFSRGAVYGIFRRFVQSDRTRIARLVLHEPVTQADFTYKITPNTIMFADTGNGSRSVSNDIEAVLRKIEYWHQGSIAGFKVMYKDENGLLDGIRWDGQQPGLAPGAACYWSAG
jgi:hypothetical protein